MSRSEIPVTDITRTTFPVVSPISQIVSSATTGHFFTGNTGQEYLEIVNASGSATATVECVLTADGLNTEDLSIGIPAGTTLIGPFKKSTFNQNNAGDVYVNVSDDGLLLRAYRLVRAA